VTKFIPAKGKKAFLCRSFRGKPFLRVKLGPEPENYVDCQVAHADLEVEILDDDAVIYLEGDRAILDYSTETITGGKKPPA
jgi:hypothetical protein